MAESKQSGMIAWSGPTCVAHDAGDGWDLTHEETVEAVLLGLVVFLL